MTNMIKLDTHVHISEVSACGRLTAEQMVSLYRKAGYAAIVITDHLKIADIPADAHSYETLERVYCHARRRRQRYARDAGR